MKCPHCKVELTPHEGTGAKEGALHCYECGCCFLSDGQTPREGVPMCERAQVKQTSPSVEPEPAPEPEEEPKKPTRSRK